MVSPEVLVHPLAAGFGMLEALSPLVHTLSVCCAFRAPWAGAIFQDIGSGDRDPARSILITNRLLNMFMGLLLFFELVAGALVESFLHRGHGDLVHTLVGPTCTGNNPDHGAGPNYPSVRKAQKVLV